MAALGQTITVVNKSGKVVSTSKHLVNIFKEAKASYQERKAELRQAREPEVGKRRTPRAIDDTHSASSSRRPSTSRQSSRRSSVDRDRSHEREQQSHRSRPTDHHRRSSSGSIRSTRRAATDGAPRDRPQGYHSPRRSPTSPNMPTSPLRREAEIEHEEFERGLVRRRSYNDDELQLAHRPAPRRAATSPIGDIDMDLAYGDEPPPLPVGHSRAIEEEEFRVKVTGLQRLLEEMNCLHHSATQTIKSLEKNPEAMAAVALTLAEISNLATKMAPGALSAMKGSFPAIIALLASPEFLIAAGVGVGLTVVALGGYKIIKKIRSKNEEKEPMILEEVPDVSRIEHWRRGIAMESMDDTASIGTSVEGEFLTPKASMMLREEGVLPPKEKKKKGDKEKDKKGDKSKKSKKEDKDKKSKSERTDKSSKLDSEESSSRSNRKGPKEKEPSGLRMIFK